jgi:hypothetical protein
MIIIMTLSASINLHKRQCVRKVAVRFGYGKYIWLSASNLPLKCAVVSLYSFVKQRLKCNIGKVCNFLIDFLLTMVLLIEKRVFYKRTATFRTHCITVGVLCSACY